MQMNNRFTEEELDIAKSVDLCSVASFLGYTVKKIGKYYTLKEMDSIRVYNRTNWYRWSRQSEKGSNGGSQIDFLRVFAGMDVKEAVFWLLDFAGYKKADDSERNNSLKHCVDKSSIATEEKEFVLPKESDSFNYLYSYLQNERMISRKCIDYFVSHKLIYESRDYHNIVFKGNDKNGATRFASMRGVFDKNGHAFKCDVKGNDKTYGFNVANDNSDELEVFEGAIDLLSYCDIYDDYETNKIALGMVADAPLETFLKEHPGIKFIRLCIDNDEPGRKASKALKDKYEKQGYEVSELPPPKDFKDYNDWIKAVKSKNIIPPKKCR